MTKAKRKKCPYCKEIINSGAIICPHCRESQYKRYAIGGCLLLILFFCIFITTLPEQPTETPISTDDSVSVKGYIETIAAIKTVTETVTVVETVIEISEGESNISTQPPRQIVIAPAFGEIRSNVQNMTEAQWKAFLPTLGGMKVENWTGWVKDVNVISSGYELWVDMDSPDALFSTYDVVFKIPNDIALEMQKAQKVTFSGKIKRVREFLGSVRIYLEDVIIQ